MKPRIRKLRGLWVVLDEVHEDGDALVTFSTFMQALRYVCYETTWARYIMYLKTRRVEKEHKWEGTSTPSNLWKSWPRLHE